MSNWVPFKKKMKFTHYILRASSCCHFPKQNEVMFVALIKLMNKKLCDISAPGGEKIDVKTTYI